MFTITPAQAINIIQFVGYKSEERKTSDKTVTLTQYL